MLTSVLLDDCRDFITEVILRLRTLSDSSFALCFIEIGGDAVVCLESYAEAVNNSEKVSILQCALRSFKRLQARIELAEKTACIPEALTNEWLARIKKLISRLKNALLDCKKHNETPRSLLGVSKKLFATARLEIKTPSETDISYISEALSELFPETPSFSHRDAVRELIVNEAFGKISLIFRKDGQAAVGVAVVTTDRYDRGRVRVDILISEEFRCRGYFTEALEGFTKNAFQSEGKRIVSVYVSESCDYLTYTCSRLGFLAEGKKRASGGGFSTVMSMLR